jgi:hypothetical protein
MASDAGSAAWSFDLDLWGVCAQGPDPAAALSAFRARYGEAEVAEAIEGDEQAFSRDLQPATDAELLTTMTILDRQRVRSLRVLRLPDEVLDRDDPERVLPHWAGWRTIRQTLWHIADTESRYYLPHCELPSRPRAAGLEAELVESAAHVRTVLSDLPRSIDARLGGEIWTSTKLLRRLAWHEAGELQAIGDLLTRWGEGTPR